MDALMTVEEVAQLFRLNELTIRRYIKAGKLKAIKVGGRIRVRREDVNDLLQPPGSESPIPPELEGLEPIVRDDPLFRLVGIGRSGIKGGISGDKYRWFREAFGEKG